MGVNMEEIREMVLLSVFIAFLTLEARWPVGGRRGNCQKFDEEDRRTIPLPRQKIWVCESG